MLTILKNLFPDFFQNHNNFYKPCAQRLDNVTIEYVNSPVCSFYYGYLFFSALGPRPSVPRSPRPTKFVGAVFDFLPVCVVKCSCAALVKYSFEFSIHKY